VLLSAVASLKKSRTNPISLVPLLLHSQVLIKKKDFFFLLMKHVLSYCICIFFSILWSWLLKYEFSLFFYFKWGWSGYGSSSMVFHLRGDHRMVFEWLLLWYWVIDPWSTRFSMQIMPFVMRWICHLIRRICVLATLFSIWRT
jgi:hypothetical protein